MEEKLASEEASRAIGSHDKLDNLLIFIADVPEGREFFLRSGAKIKNLPELRAYLSEASEEEFTYHCNTSKNDYRNWIKEVIADLELAERMQLSNGKEELIKILEGRLAEYAGGRMQKGEPNQLLEQGSKAVRIACDEMMKRSSVLYDDMLKTFKASYDELAKLLKYEFLAGTAFGIAIGLLLAKLLM